MNQEQELIAYINHLTDQRAKLEFEVIKLTKKLNELTNTTTEANVEASPSTTAS